LEGEEGRVFAVLGETYFLGRREEKEKRVSRREGRFDGREGGEHCFLWRTGGERKSLISRKKKKGLEHLVKKRGRGRERCAGPLSGEEESCIYVF